MGNGTFARTFYVFKFYGECLYFFMKSYQKKCNLSWIITKMCKSRETFFFIGNNWRKNLEIASNLLCLFSFDKIKELLVAVTFLFYPRLYCTTSNKNGEIIQKKSLYRIYKI